MYSWDSMERVLGFFFFFDRMGKLNSPVYLVFILDA
jgi:hypothetical protein